VRASAADAGSTNPLVVSGGVSGRVPMVAELKGGYYEALSLAVVRLYVGMQDAARNSSKIVTLPKVMAGFPPERFIAKGFSGLEWLEVGRLKIPVDENVSALVPYRGAQGSFPYISLADVW